MSRVVGQTRHDLRPTRAAAAAAAGCSLTRHIRRYSTWNKASMPLISSTHLGVRSNQRLLQTAATPQHVEGTRVVFEPHIDSGVLTAELLVVGLTLGAAAYWWYAVVPSARRTLAKDKRAGPLNTYLVDLQHNPNKKVERWFYSDWLQQLERRQQQQKQAAATRESNAEAQTLSDPGVSKQQHPQQGQREEATTTAPSEQSTEEEQQQQQQQQPEQGDDRQPSFWSLDNPILATAAILGIVALVTAVSRSFQLPV